MKSRAILISFIFSALLMTSHLFAADAVPYTIQSIKSVGSGYVELVGPGKIRVKDKVLPYVDTKYIRVSSIGTMTSIENITKGCMLAYASEGYAESITVSRQSCDQILTVINSAK
ncbi:MAG: hypothetical protein OEV42_14030 [Deltaproteobacteria bacterium]|nr:hypothetical protein [Deltaproteobacteria bacterium]